MTWFKWFKRSKPPPEESVVLTIKLMADNTIKITQPVHLKQASQVTIKGNNVTIEHGFMTILIGKNNKILTGKYNRVVNQGDKHEE